MAKNRRALAGAPGTVKVSGIELGTPTAALPRGVRLDSCWLPAGLQYKGLLSPDACSWLAVQLAAHVDCAAAHWYERPALPGMQDISKTCRCRC